MSAVSLSVHPGECVSPEMSDFRSYLERTLREPFTINLRGCSLMESIRICINAKMKLHPGFEANHSSLIYNLRKLEEQSRVTIRTSQVTDVFWGYFISFCQLRGLKSSSINTMCNQLRSILNWAVKYNAEVSPTYHDIAFPKATNQKIALTQDEVSRIAYFDIDRFYAGRRKDFREATHRVRDMFVLSCNLFQRHSDMVRIGPECFDRNIFKIVQQKTGNLAVVNIDKYSIDAKTTYRILDKYHFRAPYSSDISDYNDRIHVLMKDIGLDEPIRIEEKVGGQMVVNTIPKWKLISSHTARRTAVTVNVLRGHNVHDLKRCSGHSDLRVFDEYIRDE